MPVGAGTADGNSIPVAGRCGQAKRLQGRRLAYSCDAVAARHIVWANSPPLSCPLSAKKVSIVKYGRQHRQPSSRHDHLERSEIDMAADPTSRRIFLKQIATASSAVTVGPGAVVPPAFTADALTPPAPTEYQLLSETISNGPGGLK